MEWEDRRRKTEELIPACTAGRRNSVLRCWTICSRNCETPRASGSRVRLITVTHRCKIWYFLQHKSFYIGHHYALPASFFLLFIFIPISHSALPELGAHQFFDKQKAGRHFRACQPLFPERGISAEYYFAIFSQKFMRICATSARVAVPAGSSTPLPLPESRPALTAQSIASRAQSEIAP